jgi:hypothetical protein
VQIISRPTTVAQEAMEALDGIDELAGGRRGTGSKAGQEQASVGIQAGKDSDEYLFKGAQQATIQFVRQIVQEGS